MTINQKRRSAVEKVVEYERADHRVHVLSAQEIRQNPVMHATSWAEKMHAQFKLFGDSPAENPLLWHFVFNSVNRDMNEYHQTVHDTFRALVGVEFMPLTEATQLQAVAGRAALYGKGVSDAAGELQLAWYAAVELGSPAPVIF